MAKETKKTNNYDEEFRRKPCIHKADAEREIDELLETIWEFSEKGDVTAEILEKNEEGRIAAERLGELEQIHMIKKDDGKIKFTEKGQKRARSIVRRHRLTERMLVDLFDIPQSDVEQQSCEFEHILSAEVTDSICSFLGHPTNCPHGKPIPKGECCGYFTTVVKPLVSPLTELSPGEKGRITFIASKDRHRLQRLSSLGIMPDAHVVMEQKMPAVVIRVGETEVALDRNLVSEIYVKRVNAS